MTETTKATKIETVTCSRCGGSGHYSFCLSYGTRCFKCAGGGVVYTKRGYATKLFFENLLSIPASEVKPGMKVKALVITAGGQLGGETWSLVTAIEDNAVTKRGGHYVGSEVVYDGLNLITEKCIFVGVSPDTVYRVAATAEVKQAALAKALEFQETLTKSGTPRKRAKLINSEEL